MKLSELGLTRSQIFLASFILAAVIIFLALRIVVGPIALSMFFAYIFNPTLTRLEKRGWSRASLATHFVFWGLLLVVISVWVVFPILYAQLVSLVHQLPQFREYIENTLLPLVMRTLGELLGDATLKKQVFRMSDILPSSAVASPSFIISGVGKSTQILFNTLLGIVLTPFLTYYFIRYSHVFGRFFRGFIPRDLRKQFNPLIHEFDVKLRAVLGGQIMVILLLTSLYASALGLSGMPFGLAVGVITGVVRIVPYLDLLIGGSLTFFVLVTNNQPADVVVPVVISFSAIQVLDMLLITPRIVGRASGIHPFIVILGILCFGDWFGFFGVLLAIPLTTVGGVLLKSLISVYKQSEFFQNHYQPDHTGNPS